MTTSRCRGESFRKQSRASRAVFFFFFLVLRDASRTIGSSVARDELALDATTSLFCYGRCSALDRCASPPGSQKILRLMRPARVKRLSHALMQQGPSSDIRSPGGGRVVDLVIYLHLPLRPDIGGTSVEMYHMFLFFFFCLRWEEAKFPRCAAASRSIRDAGWKGKKKERMETSLTASAGASPVCFETRGTSPELGKSETSWRRGPT